MEAFVGNYRRAIVFLRWVEPNDDFAHKHVRKKSGRAKSFNDSLGGCRMFIFDLNTPSILLWANGII